MLAREHELVNEAIWQKCLGQLENEVNGDQFETYLRPLQADFSKGGLTLLAPIVVCRGKGSFDVLSKNQ